MNKLFYIKSTTKFSPNFKYIAFLIENYLYICIIFRFKRKFTNVRMLENVIFLLFCPSFSKIYNAKRLLSNQNSTTDGRCGLK